MKIAAAAVAVALTVAACGTAEPVAVPLTWDTAPSDKTLLDVSGAECGHEWDQTSDCSAGFYEAATEARALSIEQGVTVLDYDAICAGFVGGPTDTFLGCLAGVEWMQEQIDAEAVTE